MGALDCVSADRMKSTESTDVFTINVGSNSCLNEPRRDLESQFSKSNTSGKHSFFWTLGIDIPLVIIGAGWPSIRMSRNLSLSVGNMKSPTNSNFNRPRTHQALFNSLWLYRSYLYGLFLNFSACEVMKIIVGAPRPSFFEICQPDTARTCQGSEYVEMFECTSSVRFSAWTQRDSNRSFFSGHSSLSVHCALFIAWYLQRRAFNWHHRVVFVVPFLQAILVVYASLCALTRVTDNKHHWWDVLAGVGAGIASAVYSVLVLCSNFSYAKRPDDSLTERRDSGSMIYSSRRPELIS